MPSYLPTFFKLSGYNKFEYKPRYYSAEKERNEARERRIEFKKKHFERNSQITDQIRRERTAVRKKYMLISNLIRLTLIILFVLVAYLLARYFGLLWQSVN